MDSPPEADRLLALDKLLRLSDGVQAADDPIAYLRIAVRKEAERLRKYHDTGGRHWARITSPAPCCRKDGEDDNDTPVELLAEGEIR